MSADPRQRIYRPYEEAVRVAARNMRANAVSERRRTRLEHSAAEMRAAYLTPRRRAAMASWARRKALDQARDARGQI